MISMLKNWKGAVEIDSTRYNSIQDAMSVLQSFSDDIHIKLLSNSKQALESTTNAVETISETHEERITVKAYMTKEATPEFDFMAKWNDNKPMPLRTMQGEKIKETRGMAYYKLHGYAEPVITCMRCGRVLTNPVSQHYGIGPECITKIPMLMHLDINDVDEIKKKLVEVTWEGWVIKSAILESEEV